MKKKLIPLSILVLMSHYSWASEDIPVFQSTIDPPPDTAPIDNLLPLAFFISIVFAGYYFNRRRKSLYK